MEVALKVKQDIMLIITTKVTTRHLLLWSLIMLRKM